MVYRYLRRMGNKTIPGEAPPSLESFYPPWVAGKYIDLPQSRCCGLFANKHKKRVFIVKTQEHRRFEGCLTVVTHKEVALNRIHLYVVIVTPWRLFGMQNKACHPLRLKPYRYIQKISNTVLHLSIYDIFVSGNLCCVCLYAHKSWLILMDN